MLSPLDDFPYHQIPEPMRLVGTSDRNFYDRYYFNCHNRSDELFLIMGMGQYPNLGVADAFACILHDGQHRVVRASRELGADRSDLSVGPLRVEVLEGLRRLRFVCEAGHGGVAFDLTWDGAVPALLEPRHAMREFGRNIFDSTRFAQLGGWTGRIEVPGGSWDVTPDRWWGSRDRSWGIRPVGDAEPQGIRASVPHPGFFWIYAPMQFEDHAVVVIVQERSDGARVLEEAVRVWADPDRPHDLLGSPSHDLAFDDDAVSSGPSGLAFPTGARLLLHEPDGSPLVIEAEPLLRCHLMLGTGYGIEEDWRFGMHQGPLVVQDRHYDLTTDEGRSKCWGLIDSVARYRVTEGATAGAVGESLFEFFNIGTHHRYFPG